MCLECNCRIILSRKRMLVALCIVLFVLRPFAAHAVSLGLGGSVWYVWWKPYWGKNSHYTKSWGGFPRNGALSHYYEKNSINSSALYGPVLSLSLPKHFKISSAFMYGEFTGSGKGWGPVLAGYAFMFNRTTMNIKRYDCDSMISYSITNFFQVFLGFKYMHYDYTIRGSLPWWYGGPTWLLMLDNIKKKYDEYAPGLGFGFIIPLVKGSFYLLINGSIIYNFTQLETSVKSIFFLDYRKLLFPTTPTDNSLSKIGCNASAAFAYYIHPVRSTVSVGFRYQMFKLLESDASESIIRQRSLWEHFYGMTAGLMVNIDFTPRSGEKEEKEL
jgi:hypothetical protein